MQTNTNGFFITYVNIRYIQFELASSKARITSVKSLKQESVIQSGLVKRVDIDRADRNDHYSSFNDIVTMPTRHLSSIVSTKVPILGSQKGDLFAVFVFVFWTSE